QVMSCVWDSPDFVFVATDGTIFLGSENFRKATDAWLSAFESIDVVEDEVRFIPAGDSLLVVGKATYTLTSKDGASFKLSEVWTDVRKKIGGQWIMVLDHAHALATPVK
ncbi:YybH family protein, partial [Acidobacteriota bacterium]